MRGRDPKSIPTNRGQLIVSSSNATNVAPTRSRGNATASATVPTSNRPTAAPTHVLQTDPTSQDRSTSLIRGIRGQVECDHRIDETNPPRSLQCAK